MTKGSVVEVTKGSYPIGPAQFSRVIMAGQQAKVVCVTSDGEFIYVSKGGSCGYVPVSRVKASTTRRDI